MKVWLWVWIRTTELIIEITEPFEPYYTEEITHNPPTVTCSINMESDGALLFKPYPAESCNELRLGCVNINNEKKTF